MAKSPMAGSGVEPRDLAERNTERAQQVANYGMDWLRDLTEQSVGMFEGFLTTAQKAVDTLDHQAAEMRQRSMALTAQTLANTLEFTRRVVRVNNPEEIIQLQAEFLSRQAQTLADQTKELGQLGQKIMHEADEAARSTVGQMQAAVEPLRRRMEAGAQAG
jgi:hypothetical protein